MIDQKLESYVKLDLLNINKEIEEYSQQVYEVGMAYAEAMSERDMLKEQLDIIDASVSKQMRESAAASSFKLTESQIKLDIPLTDEHIDAFTKYNDASERSYQVYALADAIKAKGKMIEKAIDLAMRGFININDTSKLKEEIAQNRKF